MKLIRKIEEEIDRLFIGYAFNGKNPAEYTKAYLRIIAHEIQNMRVELIERLHGTTPFYIGTNVSTMSREEVLKVIFDTITSIKEVLVEECKGLIIDDIILKDALSHTGYVLLVNLRGDDETLYVAKHANIPEAQYQIVREFIFHVFLATHKQIELREYRIVKLIGICRKDKDVYIVTERLELGNLIDLTLRPENKIRNHQHVLLHDEWFYLLYDILIGMRHLHTNHVLHRNLETYKILVRNNPHHPGSYQALISDLGTAAFYNAEFDYVYPPLDCKYGTFSYSYEDIHGATLNYYISPPEVLHKLKFSYASDSYSFGVVLWRLLFGGRLPYANAEDLESLVDMVNSGLHLEIDEEWENSLKNAMTRFLSFDPKKRPLLASSDTLALLSDLENPVTELAEGLKELRKRYEIEEAASSSEVVVNNPIEDNPLRCAIQ